MDKDFSPLTRIPFDAPEFLEAAFGYHKSEAPYVAFYWSPAGDELYCEDSYGFGGTIDHHAWLMLMRHPLSIVFLGFDFGSSDSDARDWLLLDRESRALFAGPREAVAAILAPKELFPTEDAELPELTSLLLDSFEEVDLDPAAIMAEVQALMREEHKRVRQLEGWLDERLAELVRDMDAHPERITPGWELWLTSAKAHLARRMPQGTVRH